MIFVNSRRLAERLASALNDTAGEEIALAHHCSIARERRTEIEDLLKRGELPAIVATSSRRSTETTPRDRPSRRSSGKPDSSRGAVGT